MASVPTIGDEQILRTTSVPDFAVELRVLTNCDQLVLSSESTVTSLMKSLAPGTPCICLGTLQPTAHLRLLPGTRAEYTQFFNRNNKMLNYENRISQPWLHLTTKLWGFLLEIPIRDLLVFHEKVLELCIAEGDGANKMGTRLLGFVPDTPASIKAAKVKYYEVYDDMVLKFMNCRQHHRSHSQSNSSGSQEDSTKPATFWKALCWTRLLQLSRQAIAKRWLRGVTHRMGICHGCNKTKLSRVR